MAMDLFERLADMPVPPAPPEQQFDRAVHQRINQRLFWAQIFDFVVKGCGFALVHFTRGVAAALRLTVTGKLEGAKKPPEASK